MANGEHTEHHPNRKITSGRVPPPATRRANSGRVPPANSPKSLTQEDKDNNELKLKVSDLRRQGDKFRSEGGHRSADQSHRQADEIESRMASGSKQLDANAMSTIRSSAHLKDRDGGGYGRHLGDNY